MLNKDYSGPTASKTKAGKDDASPITSPTCFNFTRKEEPIFGDEYSLFRSRSASLCSSDAGSVRSTGTVCESDISSRHRSLRSTEPPSRGLSPLPNSRSEKASTTSLDATTSSSNCSRERKPSRTDEPQENERLHEESSKLPENNSTNKRINEYKRRVELRRKKSEEEKLNPVTQRNNEINEVMNRKAGARLTAADGAHAEKDMEDDVQSVSTVSGSGIDFFRKFVQRKGEGCRECEDQFRREVLIDRLVTDSLSTRSAHAVRANKGPNSDPRPMQLRGDPQETPATPSLEHHRCGKHRRSNSITPSEDNQSVSTRSSVSMVSSVSGTGLLFLKNYLKKKKSGKSGSRSSTTTTSSKDLKNMSFFNSTPLPFPPPGDYYGPAFIQDIEGEEEEESPSRRLSMCSTVADLLAEDFDCDDTELKNLDWEDWEGEGQHGLLPEDMTYDDLVSVISESFYSDDPDLADLCDLDLEGRKTVVANEKDLVGEDGDENSLDQAATAGQSPAGICISSGENSAESPVHEPRIDSSKSRYGSYKSSASFMQDLEAELELPPMSPVSDEKEEAVRAISRTISKYIRTKSDGSYEETGSRQSYYSRTRSNDSYDELDRTKPCYAGERYSRQDDYGRMSRGSGYNDKQASYSRRRGCYEDPTGRDSRISVTSPAMSDYLPELAPEPSPAPSRRPLSQLLVYDNPTSPVNASSPGGHTTLPVARGANNAVRSPATTQLTQQQISQILSLPKNEFSFNFEGKSPELKHPDLTVPNPSETRLRTGSDANKTKNANRDSLLCGNNTYSPAVSPPPAQPVARPHFYRHSSTNSTDSGCPLIEDKVPSLSPTPSPRTNIELLSSNRTKLANFWERSMAQSQQPEVSNWVPGNQQTARQGFQPVKSSSGSSDATGLANSQDRLAHFLDVTRRAAEGRRNGRGYFHRASTGSDCSDFFERIPPLSPAAHRRRDSLTEYFV